MKYCEIHYRDIWQKEEGVLIRNLIQTNPLDRIVREDAERARRCPSPPTFFNLRCSTGIYLKVSFWTAL